MCYDLHLTQAWCSIGPSKPLFREGKSKSTKVVICAKSFWPTLVAVSYMGRSKGSVLYSRCTHWWNETFSNKFLEKNGLHQRSWIHYFKLFSETKVSMKLCLSSGLGENLAGTHNSRSNASSLGKNIVLLTKWYFVRHNYI